MAPPRTPPPWPTIAASAIIALLAYFAVKLIQHRRSYRDLPKPPHHFLWGHLKLMGEVMSLFPRNVHFQVAITTMAQKYRLPGLWYLDLWPMADPQLIITDPELALYVTVLKNHPKHYVEAELMDPIMGKGNIATTEGHIWKAAHNMLAPAFAASHVRNTIGGVAEEVMVFRSILEDLAHSGAIFSLEDLLKSMIFDVIGRVTFNYSLEAQKRGSPLLSHFTDICSAALIERDTWNPVKSFSARRNRLAATRKLDPLLEKIIRGRFEELQRGDADLSKRRGLSIIDLVLRERLEEAQKTGKDALDANFMAVAATHIKTLLLAATGTTTDTLCFTYMLLSAHPEVVQKLREEHDSVFTPGIEASYAMLQQDPHKLSDLHYTTNVIKEVLRFYPVGNTARAEDSTGSITYNGKQYSTRGQMICPVQHAMHMDPSIFPNASAFDPDRFSRNDAPRNAWRPFERGPRACLGQTLAMDDMKVALLLTVRDFDFACAALKPSKTQLVPWTDLDLTFGDRAFQEFILEARPRDGMPMTVKKAIGA